jgi:hypothetical protein
MMGGKWTEEAKENFRSLRATWKAGRKAYTKEEREQMGLNQGNWKQKNPEAHAAHAKAYRHRNKEKIDAQNAVNYAIRSGKLVRGKCAICSSEDRVHAHHASYAPEDRLKVTWLCYQCHAYTGVMLGQVKKVYRY